MTKPSSLNGQSVKWAISLSQYEMQFLSQKATKEQAVADFLAEHSDSRATRLYEDLIDEVAKVYMTQTSFEKASFAIILRQRIKDGSDSKHYSWSGGSARISTKLCNLVYILINQAVFQQCCVIQCSLDRDATC